MLRSKGGQVLRQPGPRTQGPGQWTHRDLGENVEHQGQDREVDLDPLASKSLPQILWHRHHLHGMEGRIPPARVIRKPRASQAVASTLVSELWSRVNSCWSEKSLRWPNVPVFQPFAHLNPTCPTTAEAGGYYPRMWKAPNKNFLQWTHDFIQPKRQTLALKQEGIDRQIFLYNALTGNKTSQPQWHLFSAPNKVALLWTCALPRLGLQASSTYSSFLHYNLHPLSRVLNPEPAVTWNQT